MSYGSNNQREPESGVVPPNDRGMLSWALSYASQGWQVFPVYGIENGRCGCRRGAGCDHPGKHPMTPHGFHDATVNEEAIRKWWSESPCANIAIRTGRESGILVVDVDGEEGGDTLSSLEREYGMLPQTITVTTGHGRHLYFKYDPRLSKNSVGALPGIDIRTDGGCVIAPPSNHVSGKTYSWETSIENASIATLPEWLIKALSPKNGTKVNLENAYSQAGQGGQIFPGNRNNSLFLYAAHLKENGLSGDEIQVLLTTYNATRCDPPLGDSEVQQIAQSAVRHEVNGTDFDATELGLADRLVKMHGDAIRFCTTTNKWLTYDGTRWIEDQTHDISDKAIKVVRDLELEAASEPSETRQQILRKFAKSSQTHSKIRNMVALAESEPGIPVTVGEFNKNPYLLNVLNGTLDIKAGTLIPHSPNDMLSMVAPVTYDAGTTCSRWERFLEEIFAVHPELIPFIQQLCGYCLTGDTSGQFFMLLYGTGANGKSTLVNVIMKLLGDYAKNTPMDSLIPQKNPQIRNDLARLKDARFVSASEPDFGKALSESLIKSLTGSDSITARYLYGEFFEFYPQFKIWIATNHKPNIHGADLGIWRRVLFIPFETVIPSERQDKQLQSRLESELSGILNWALAGAKDWLENGFQIPEIVRSSTQEYRGEMDEIGQFISERCEVAAEAVEQAYILYGAYVTWARDRNQNPVSMKAFSQMLDEHGIPKRRNAVGNLRTGVRFRAGA